MRKQRRKKSIAFPLQSIKTGQFMEILRVTQCNDFMIELYNIKDSRGNYVDKVFHIKLNDLTKEMVQEMLQSEPEIISVYGSYQTSKEHFLDSDADVILEFMIYENVFILTCNSDLFEEIKGRILLC